MASAGCVLSLLKIREKEPKEEGPLLWLLMRWKLFYGRSLILSAAITMVFERDALFLDVVDKCRVSGDRLHFCVR